MAERREGKGREGKACSEADIGLVLSIDDHNQKRNSCISMILKQATASHSLTLMLEYSKVYVGYYGCCTCAKHNMYISVFTLHRLAMQSRVT